MGAGVTIPRGAGRTAARLRSVVVVHSLLIADAAMAVAVVGGIVATRVLTVRSLVVPGSATRAAAALGLVVILHILLCADAAVAAMIVASIPSTVCTDSQISSILAIKVQARHGADHAP